MGDRVKVKLVSTGTTEKGTKTGFYKTTMKRSKPKSGKAGTGGAKLEKLELKCFDPRAFNQETGRLGMHVPFKEDKIK